MKIWVYLNGIQQGPYTLEELADMPVKPTTPVWYEGLPQWLPADQAPETAKLFGVVAASDASGQSSHEADVQAADVPRQETAGPASSANGSRPIVDDRLVSVGSADEPPCPPTYMAWSVIVMICCCQIGGILAIIFTAMTTSSYNRGDYAKAAKMSERAQWMIILSIAIGLVSIPFMWMLYL